MRGRWCGIAPLARTCCGRTSTWTRTPPTGKPHVRFWRCVVPTLVAILLGVETSRALPNRRATDRGELGVFGDRTTTISWSAPVCAERVQLAQGDTDMATTRTSREQGIDQGNGIEGVHLARLASLLALTALAMAASAPLAAQQGRDLLPLSSCEWVGRGRVQMLRGSWDSGLRRRSRRRRAVESAEDR